MSLVEVSPSTEIALKLRSAARRRAACRYAGVAAASVITNASIVAMFGWIMPAPFANPTTRPRRPPTRNVAARDLRARRRS